MSDDEEYFFEKIEELIDERLKSLKTIETEYDAKAFLGLQDRLPKSKMKMITEMKKKAKKLIDEMDGAMRVFVCEQLYPDYKCPGDSSDSKCDWCEMVYDERNDYECKCREFELYEFATAIGCDDVPGIPGN